VLQKGEISTVYKVRNLLDDSLYAIKEVTLEVNHSNHDKVRERLNNLLKEVRLIANLKSEFVVSYKNAWVEVIFDHSNVSENMETQEDDYVQRKDSTRDEVEDLSECCIELKKKTSFLLLDAEYK
jgi:serine/threonine protein kinase